VARLTISGIEAAARAIDPVFTVSPQYECEALSAELGFRLLVKVETQNPIRSFKGRGADWFVSRLTSRGPLVCASAGNFGQGLAYAARKRGIPLTIFVPHGANPLKVERMRSLGAEIRTAGEDFDAAKAAARAYAERHAHRFVEDGREPEISEGAGTVGRELLSDPGALDAVLVPLGNGALLAGVGTWIKAQRPATRVLGVCAAGAPAMARSLAEASADTVVATDRVETIADGIAVRVPIPEALQDLRPVVDEVLLVDDDAILAAMRAALDHLGLVVEPAGAVGLAAAQRNAERFAGRRAATILCGGNLTPEQVRRWLW
jgi:threonine dehydratase